MAKRKAKPKSPEPVSRPPPDIPVSHPERDALLAAIVDNWEDDTPRLVYADWQDEHDQPEHAELIRVQCELKALGAPTTETGKSRRRSLLDRERKLLAGMAHLWPNVRRGGSHLPESDRGLFGYRPVSLSARSRGLKYCWVPRKGSPAPRLPFDRVHSIELGVYSDGVRYLPRLREASWLRWLWLLHFCECRIGPGALTDLAACPYLDRVSVLGFYGGSVDSRELVRLVARALDGSLKDLTVYRCKVTGTGGLAAALEVIAALPRASRLEELALSDSGVDGRAAAVLLGASAFESLSQLKLRSATVRAVDSDALTRRFGERLQWE